MSHTGAPGVRWPLRWRLPLLICGLLLASVTAFGWAAYREVERALLESAHARLQNVGRQLAALLVAQSVQARVDEARRLATHPAVTALAHAPESDAGLDATRHAAVAYLDAFLKASPQTLGVELWSATGERLLARPAPAASGTSQGTAAPPSSAAASSTASASSPPASAPPSASEPSEAARARRLPVLGFSVLHVVHDVVAYDLVVDIPAPAPTPAPGLGPGATPTTGTAPAVGPGRLLLRRRVSSSNTAAAIAGLIGGGMAVQLGAKSGGVWTDLSVVIPPPPVQDPPTRIAEYQAADGAPHLGAATSVAGTPWLIWVALPRHVALAPARVFLARMIPLGLFVALLGSAIAWGAARRITKPLDELTGAADAIANDDLSKRVRVARGDEIGRLGAAFNTMAQRVEDSHHRLDARVTERTRDLEQAVATLQQTQQELVRREKLATLGQLASGVGHELRNPLGVMTNAVYFLDMVQPDAPPQVKEYHSLLRAQIGLSEKIVSDLLDFARIKPPRRERLPLARLVDDQLARVTLPDGVSVVRDLPPNLPLAHVDPVQMGQVLLNLLVNAVQAMEDRGGVLTVRGAAEGHRVRLDVIDTGPGVPPELHERIFEALFTTKARGIGLGLAVSRSLAEANGGQLTLSRSSGEGATFTLVMPNEAGPRST